MSRKRTRVIGLAAAAGLLASSGIAFTVAHESGGDRAHIMRISATQADAVATGTMAGTVQSTRLVGEDLGAAVYVVRIRQADGTTMDVDVDAATGRVLAQQLGAGSDSDNDGG